MDELVEGVEQPSDDDIDAFGKRIVELPFDLDKVDEELFHVGKATFSTRNMKRMPNGKIGFGESKSQTYDSPTWGQVLVQANLFVMGDGHLEPDGKSDGNVVMLDHVFLEDVSLTKTVRGWLNLECTSEARNR
jgi:hypothetical protein